MGHGKLILGIDTCGPSGSVALARLQGARLEILGQTPLAGRTYSATLISAVDELLRHGGMGLGDVAGIVVVNGPGSFTGVRVGLSAAKGLAEPRHTPVAAVSRLAVLAAKSGVVSAALDAHRHEVFLRIAGDGIETREILASASELEGIKRRPERIAICDDGAAALLGAVWSKQLLVWAGAPMATDAIQVAAPRIESGEVVDPGLLDGHYLRRSDAEIFGDSPLAAGRK